MTNKELLYVEDALGHEQFMKCCSKKTSAQLKWTQIVRQKMFNKEGFYYVKIFKWI